MKPADLILVRGDEGLSHEIEWITHSPYSHVAGLVKPNELIEAQAFRKTGYQGLDFYAGGCADIFTCDILTDEQRAQIVAYVMSEKGKKYGYKLLGWELGHYILHIDFPIDPHSNPDCSQLWVEAYRSVGVDLCPGLLICSPGDIGFSKLMRNEGKFY